MRLTTSVSLVAVVLGVIAAGCSSTQDSSEGSAAAIGDVPKEFSYVGKAVHEALMPQNNLELSPEASKDGVWGESVDNALTGNWLLQTPPADTWGRDQVNVAMECTVLVNGSPSNQCAAKGIREAADPSFNHPACDTIGAACDTGGTCGTLDATVKHDGEEPQKLCLSDTDKIVDDIYNLVLSAQNAVDIATLTPPDGRFEAALRNAITRLSDRPNPPRVRIFTGDYPMQAKDKVHDYPFDAAGVLRSLTRDIVVDATAKDADLTLKNPNFKVAVGKNTVSISSFNHAKVAVVDGKSAIVGGMNMWANDYLIREDPVHDLSIHVSGSAAADAHMFTNQLWDHLCAGGGIGIPEPSASVGFDVCKGASTKNGQSRPLDSDFVRTPGQKGPGDIPIIAVGRLGDISASEQAGDWALPAMIRAAKTRVRIAQQDIGPPKAAGVIPWPEEILRAIKDRLQHGVEVDIVVSNPGGTDGYGHGWTLPDVRAKIEGSDDTPLSAEQACKLHLAGLSASERGTWASGKAYLLHDKLIIVDDQAFYVGSQNIYTANLSEYGFIVDSKAPTAQLGAYYDTMWGFSSKSGSGAAEDLASCGQR